MKLTHPLSSYLDLLRFTAALTVLFGHMGQDGFDMSWMPLSHMSHDAVIVFFVMSGFIIYSATAGRVASGRDYLVARASRVYSVALPGVLFSVAISLLIESIVSNPKALTPAYRPFSFVDIAGCLLFINESWTSFKFSTQLTLNGPYWSLCYEVWYYVIFGLFFFVRSQWRWPLVALACLVAGPQILALFPIWLAGAWLAARRGEWPRLSQPVAWAIFLLSPLVAFGIEAGDYDQVVKSYLHNAIPGFWRLEGSQRLVTDHIIGVAVVANIVAFMSLGPAVHERFAAWRGRFAALASFSFTLYLFHRPLLDLAGALLPPKLHSSPASIGIALIFVLMCWLLSFATERQLPAWRRALSRVVPGRRMAAT